MVSPISVHLLVLVHGLWGNPSHLAELFRIMCEAKTRADDGTVLEILVAETNAEESTYDGIDWGAERVAREVLHTVSMIEAEGRVVTRFSVAGYSLGGLISRYLVGILYKQDFFQKITPVNFSTFATPHIGMPRYPGVIPRIFKAIGPRFLSRTGTQLFVTDQWTPGGQSLLEVMADPEHIFYRALELFANVTFYANAVNDHMVPYVTAAVELDDPFLHHEETGLEIEVDAQYLPLIKSWRMPETPPPAPKKSLLPSLPPSLQFDFPYNLVFYASVPILIPPVLGLALLWLASSSRRSRARIRMLEGDDSYRGRITHALAAMEKRAEDTLVGVLEHDAGARATSALATAATAAAAAAAPEASREVPRRNAAADTSAPPPVPAQRNRAKTPSQPTLTDAQRRIVASLNGLPGLRKERAFIHPVRNSHAIIVAREVHIFEAHRLGWGVIRHWVDHFQL